MSQPSLEDAISLLLGNLQSEIETKSLMIEAALNSERDEFNELFDELVSKRDENMRLSNKLTFVQAELANVKKEKEQAILEGSQILDLSTKIKNKAKAQELELKELKALNPRKIQNQWRETKAKNNNLKSLNADLVKQLNEAAKEIKTLKGHNFKLANKHNELVDLLGTMRHILYQEGALMESHYRGDIGGFYVYRRPARTQESIKINSDTDAVADKPFYFRVETDAGVHFDVYPLVGDEVGYSGDLPFIVPKEVGDYCKDEYSKHGSADDANYSSFKLDSKVGNDLDALISQISDITENTILK